ncbi:hypothetical protein AB0G20_21920 [Streptomyces sp. NPDC024017]
MPALRFQRISAQRTTAWPVGEHTERPRSFTLSLARIGSWMTTARHT